MTEQKLKDIEDRVEARKQYKCTGFVACSLIHNDIPDLLKEIERLRRNYGNLRKQVPALKERIIKLEQGQCGECCH